MGFANSHHELRGRMKRLWSCFSQLSCSLPKSSGFSGWEVRVRRRAAGTGRSCVGREFRKRASGVFGLTWLRRKHVPVWREGGAKGHLSLGKLEHVQVRCL